MPLLLVAYDLNKPEQDHSDLFEHIEMYSNVRLTGSSYAIITDKTPLVVCEELKKLVGKNDNLYAITLKRPYEGCGPSRANDWLKKSLTD
jgi:hypothetical protein